MLHLDLNTLPRDFSRLGPHLAEIRRQPAPNHTFYSPEYQLLYTLAGKYASIANFIVIGRGGSISGFRACFHALAEFHTTKRVHFLDTLDAEYVSFLRRRCLPDDTLIVAISKSGDNIEVVENLLCFPEYRKLVVTENPHGGYAQIAKAKELETVRHPDIGGRFSTGTECAMLPASLIYVDIKSIVDGMASMRRLCDPNREVDANIALQLACALLLAEKQGLSEVYAPIYSKPLAGSCELLTQLMHESACKEGQGQTFLFQEAPECLHHTNQKFFDGPRRMLGLFTRIERSEHEVQVALDSVTRGLTVRGLPLLELEGETLTQAMRHEWHGVRQAADDAHIPNATITLDILNPGTFGEFVAFWEYVAIYSSWLRGVNPFDQPGVEASKKLATEERRKR